MKGQCSSCRVQVEHDLLESKRWFISKVVGYKHREFRSAGFPMGGTVYVSGWQHNSLQSFVTAVCPTCVADNPNTNLHERYVIDEAWRSTPIDMRAERILDIRLKPVSYNDGATGFRSARLHDLVFADKEISELRFYPLGDEDHLIWAVWKTDGQNSYEEYDSDLLEKSIRNSGFDNVIEYLDAAPPKPGGMDIMVSNPYQCEFPSPAVIMASAKAGSTRLLEEVPDSSPPDAYQDVFAIAFWKQDWQLVLTTCQNAPPCFRAAIARILMPKCDLAARPSRLLILLATLCCAALGYLAVGLIWFKPYLNKPGPGLLALLCMFVAPVSLFIAVIHLSIRASIRKARTTLQQWMSIS